MNNSISLKRLLKPISLLATSLCIIGITSSTYAGSVVVLNTGVSDSTVTKEDIEKIYTGKKSKWSDGTKIVFVTLKKGDLHKEFLKSYVSKSPSQFKVYWKKMVFTGKGKSPKSFDSEEELITYVAKTSGAVGYASAASGDVKQVTISD